MTAKPVADWVTQQARNLSMELTDQVGSGQVPHPRSRHQVHRFLRRHLRRRGHQDYQDLLHGSASFILEADGDETVRHLDGELVVYVTAIGGMAEHAITPGPLRRLDIEAVALDEGLRTESA